MRKQLKVFTDSKGVKFVKVYGVEFELVEAKSEPVKEEPKQEEKKEAKK